ncbi:hypothetical protein M427DRAFT_51501 [Gonapodya prolifera JEL478]|uniref:Gfd2/YDR514C-like C-terminal domain-containing protein n=1 Tax=Gonapodya prolifera (strain JEL478) TaxID=1344416 RepID=A0A139AWX9_GONPJ|nr:hypothetical protein M427DRAFT_51501 [Gonapodya prolifera JEL478]|eukprot:KXS21251.1 hypothetical protein M427DRAFT_51501 [Gonapodya prolifera JEL478]
MGPPFKKRKTLADSQKEKAREPPFAPCPIRDRSPEHRAVLHSASALITPPLTDDEFGEQPAIIISLDLESFEHNHNNLTEVGWAIYCAKERKVVGGRHVVVERNARLRNGKFVKDNVLNYVFAIPEEKEKSSVFSRWPRGYRHPTRLEQVQNSDLDTWWQRGTLVLPLSDALELLIRESCELAGVSVSGKLQRRSYQNQSVESSQNPGNLYSRWQGLHFRPKFAINEIRPIYLAGLDLGNDLEMLDGQGFFIRDLLTACPAFSSFPPNLPKGWDCTPVVESLVPTTIESPKHQPDLGPGNSTEVTGKRKREDELDFSRKKKKTSARELAKRSIKTHLNWLDVSDVYCAALGRSMKMRVGSLRLLQSLDVDPESCFLHNAGNDARVTLDALLRLMQIIGEADERGVLRASESSEAREDDLPLGLGPNEVLLVIDLEEGEEGEIIEG